MNLEEYANSLRDGHRSLTIESLKNTAEAITSCLEVGDMVSISKLPFLNETQSKDIIKLRAQDFVFQKAKEMSKENGTLQDLEKALFQHLKDVASSPAGFDPDYMKEIAWICRFIEEKISPKDQQFLNPSF